MSQAIQRGDFDAVKKIVAEDGRVAERAASVVPGIGSGIGRAITMGMSILDGGGSLELALHTAYGAIPIPPGLRSITDAVLRSVVSLVHRESVTDAALAAARNAVPPGLPRDVFDTLAQIALTRISIERVGGALLDHYVNQYATPVDDRSGDDESRPAPDNSARAALPAGGGHPVDPVASNLRLPAHV